MTDLTEQEILHLYQAKEELLAHTTKRLFDILKPTTLMALYELLDVPGEQVTWLDTYIHEELVIIVFSISVKDDTISPFLRDILNKYHADFDGDIKKFDIVVKLALPVNVITQTKDEQKIFMCKVEADKKLPSNVDVDFDTSMLTEEQLAQLALMDMITGVQ